MWAIADTPVFPREKGAFQSNSSSVSTTMKRLGRVSIGKSIEYAVGRTLVGDESSREVLTGLVETPGVWRADSTTQRAQIQ